MRFLIIGAAGFIGTELTLYLSKKGNEIIGYDLLDEPNKSVVGTDGFTYKKSSVVAADDYRNCDCLILLAAKRPYKDFSFKDYQNNVSIVERYIGEAAENGLKNIVFASSKAVYSGDNMPWCEDDRSIPSSLYGASKLAAEEIGLYYSLSGKMSFKSLRFAQIIGMGERKGYLINTLIDNAIDKKTQVVFGSGEQNRHYIYVKDVCRAFYAAAMHAEKSSVYNIGMEKSATNLELALCVNKAFGNEGNLKHDYSKEMIGINDEMSVGKAKSELGFAAEFDLESTFKDLAESINNNG